MDHEAVLLADRAISHVDTEKHRATETTNIIQIHNTHDETWNHVCETKSDSSYTGEDYVIQAVVSATNAYIS